MHFIECNQFFFSKCLNKVCIKAQILFYFVAFFVEGIFFVLYEI